MITVAVDHLMSGGEVVQNAGKRIVPADPFVDLGPRVDPVHASTGMHVVVEDPSPLAV